jgi:TolB-like protein
VLSQAALLASLAVFSTPAPSGATGRIGVQVLALSPESGVDPASARLLTDFLVSELSGRPQLQVFGQSDLESLLKAARQQKSLECNTDADACLAEVAGARGAQWLISGSVGVLGDRLVVSIRLTDTRHHQMLAHVSEEARGSTDELFGVIKELVPKLLEQAQPNSALGSPPRQHAVLSYLLLSGALVAAVGSGISGGFALSYWENASTASGDMQKYGRPLPQDSGQLGGSYTTTKNAVEPIGIVSEVALGVAVGLGIATWVVW